MKIEIKRRISIKGLCIQGGIAALLFFPIIPLSRYFGLNFILMLLMAYLFFVAIVLLQWYQHLRIFKHGLRLMKNHQYEAAINAFKEVHGYFEKHPLKDKYRYALLITSSALPIRAMCLINVTACHVLLKNKEKASFYYKTLLTQENGKEIHLPWYDAFLKNDSL